MKGPRLSRKVRAGVIVSEDVYWFCCSAGGNTAKPASPLNCGKYEIPYALRITSFLAAWNAKPMRGLKLFFSVPNGGSCNRLQLQEGTKLHNCLSGVVG